ncbi:MAG: hypothetical protein CMP88_05150 [Gammaproteobacteria bacterium]|nr:hypothetical protein [Gammaproteobacteria bacterium]
MFSKLMFLPGLALIVWQRTNGPITFFERTTYQSLLYLGPLQIGQINQKKTADLERKVGGLREMIGLISQLIHQSHWVNLEITI